MARTINIEDLGKYVRQKTFTSWLDKFSFWNILLIWVLVISTFGCIYFFLSNSNMYLLNTHTQQPVTMIADTIYFSFVTATTTGFGDIIPVGTFKLLAMFEVIGVLLLLAMVTSKLVSIKQDAILTELYDISFNGQLNRLRSSLLLFRQNLTRFINRIEDGTLRRREANEIFIYISSLEDIINEAINMFDRPSKNGFTKIIDPVNTELIVISVTNSFEKLNELLTMMNQRRVEWKRDVTLNLINRCVNHNEKLFNVISSKEYIKEKVLITLKLRNTQVIDTIKNLLA